jgi:hypothetical protein
MGLTIPAIFDLFDNMTLLVELRPHACFAPPAGPAAEATPRNSS